MLRNNSVSYGTISQTFHWLMALAVIGMLFLGFWMHGLTLSPEKIAWYGLHKSIGTCILAAAILRYGWRLLNPRPELPAAMRWHDKLAAHLGHLALYGLMLAMPLSGWLMSSASGFPVSVFGWFTLPDLVGSDKELKDIFNAIHYYLALALIGMASVHALAALYHHFIKRDNVLRRMLPWSKPV